MWPNNTRAVVVTKNNAYTYVTSFDGDVYLEKKSVLKHTLQNILDCFLFNKEQHYGDSVREFRFFLYMRKYFTREKLNLDILTYYMFLAPITGKFIIRMLLSVRMDVDSL
jgi:hypothetical protein